MGLNYYLPPGQYEVAQVTLSEGDTVTYDPMANPTLKDGAPSMFVAHADAHFVLHMGPPPPDAIYLGPHPPTNP